MMHQPASTGAGSSRVAGIVLAAGGSTRMGAPKALICDALGETLVSRAVRTLTDGGCAPVLVVVGAEEEAIARALEGAAQPATPAGRVSTPWQLVPHPGWREGMGTSIAAGVAAVGAWSAHARPERADGVPAGAGETPGAADEAPVVAVLITAVDMPGVDARHLATLIAASDQGTRRVASAWVNAEGESVIGVPALLPRVDWPLLLQLRGESGARGLLREGGTISVFIREEHYDLDTPEALASWRARSGPRDLE